MLNENVNISSCENEMLAKVHLPSLLSLSAKSIANFDEKQLMNALHHSNWKRMSPETRLRIYQEFENRQARLDGRCPIEIRADRPMAPHHYGSHITMPDGSEIIYINPRFIANSKLFKAIDTSIFNAASGLSAVMHEGRHSFQHHVLKNDLHIISELQKTEWAVSMPGFGGKYISNGIFYAMQGIEMDARRFARRQVEKLNRYFKSIGHEDPNFSNYITQDLQDEKDFIARIRTKLTLNDINKMEQSLIEHFKSNRPNVKVDNLNIFYHAKLVLMYPEIVDPQAMLDLVDSYLDGKLGKLSTKLNMLCTNHLNTIKQQFASCPLNTFAS